LELEFILVAVIMTMETVRLHGVENRGDYPPDLTKRAMLARL
jgi:hypothetical protein